MDDYTILEIYLASSASFFFVFFFFLIAGIFDNGDHIAVSDVDMSRFNSSQESSDHVRGGFSVEKFEKLEGNRRMNSVVHKRIGSEFKSREFVAHFDSARQILIKIKFLMKAEYGNQIRCENNRFSVKRIDYFIHSIILGISQ